MFQPNWPSSGVQIVMVKDSAAHYNVVFVPPIVVASDYVGYVGYHQFYLGVPGIHMVAFGFVCFVGCGCLEYSCWGRSFVVCWSAIIVSDGRPTHNRTPTQEEHSQSMLTDQYTTELLPKNIHSPC
jgi:hypothetical protein